MTLSEEAESRLADIVELQPTKNKVLQKRWEMDSGSDVHQYLESELRDYYYRDENSLIRATPEARAIVEGEDAADAVVEVHMSDLEQMVFAVLNDPDGESESVVSVLHAVQDATDAPDITAKDVRSALQSLKRKGVAEVVYRTVPTFRLAVERERVELTDD